MPKQQMTNFWSQEILGINATYKLGFYGSTKI
jgi:hypothetical protein